MKKLFSVRTLILAGSLLLQLSTLCFHSRGAAGDVDLSFDPGSGVNGPVTAVALQPDGKVIIGGTFTTVKGLARRGLARLNADGSGDSSFNAGAVIPDYSIYPYAIALQSDGKVFVRGEHGLARLNSDGSGDTNFISGLDPSYRYGRAIAVQPDGKVLIGAEFSGGSLPGIVRLNSDGSLDNSFNAGTVFTSVYSIALQPDGKVLIGGPLVYVVNGTNHNGIARLNADGTLDSGFDPGTGVTGGFAVVGSVVVQSDGKVLIGGNFTAVNGTNRNRIARLNANGSLDNSFNPGAGIAALQLVDLVIAQPDGKVLVRNNYFTPNGIGSGAAVARLNADGSVDGAFNPGTEADRIVGSIALQSDGKVLIAGEFTFVNDTNRSRMARLNADGSLDGSFLAGRGLGVVDAIAVQPDGKVLVRNVRLNTDGSLDSTYFQPTNSSPPSPLDINFPGADYHETTAFVGQPDGKWLIGGYFFTTYVHPEEGWILRWTTFFLMRFNADGSRDTNFAQWEGYPNYDFQAPIDLGMGLTLQPDGKVLLQVAVGILRLNSNGTTDTNFNATVRGVSAYKLEADGKIFIAGGFTTVNGTNRGGIARLNANGSLDNSFNPGTGANGSVALFGFQSDGKMLIIGAFTTFNGTNRNRIARLNADGSLDSIFNAGTGPNGSILSFAFQSDGKMLISGAFTTINGTNRNRIARLNADGSLDSTFNSGTGPNGSVFSFAFQSDGKILIGGDFTMVNGAMRPSVARLYGDSTPPGPFVTWASGFGLSGAAAAADADPDSDGLPNGVEYVLGENPLVSRATVPPASVSALPSVAVSGGNMLFTFLRDDASETLDVTLKVETGMNLIAWPNVYIVGANSAGSSPGVTIAENGTAPDTITVAIPIGTTNSMFARLKITIAP